jgi:alkylation response protein AidB-like acyl-CoA dehydrogenase
MHNFELDEEHAMVRDTVRKLVQDTIGPAALDHDEHRRFVRRGFDELAQSGFLGLPIGAASGGAGLGMLALAVAVEELARGCGSTARVFLVQGGLCGRALEGLPAAGELLGALVSGARLFAWVGPHSGVRARRAGEELVLEGRAALVIAAQAAERLLVAARSEQGAMLLDVDPALAQRSPAPALGFRAAAPGAVEFAQARLPRGAVLAEGDAAAAAAERAALAAAIGGAALGIGLADASFQAAHKHAHERVAFGKPLFAQQAVRHKLEQSLRRTMAARHLCFHAARLADAGADARQSALLARLEAIAAATLASDEAIQIHGGFGFTVEYHVERHYRDAQTLGVLDGGTEALRDELAARLALS